MEAEPDGYRVLSPLVCLFQGTRRDAGEDRQQARAMAHRALRRQAPGATQCDRPYFEIDSSPQDSPRQGQAAETIKPGQIRRPISSERQKICSGNVLNADTTGD